MASAVRVHELAKSYGDVHALNGVTFDVPDGTVFGLLGPNGAGKTTIVQILTTLTTPDSGTATVAGHDVTRQADAVRRSVGIVSQKPQFDPEATGRENLHLQGRIHGLSRGQAHARADELLTRFGLADAADRLARTYSGGMQRRLDVALGLVHSPRVLFLDEPTTGLDPQARSEMWNEISTLAYTDGITTVLTTHYLEEADHLAGELAIVDRGQVVAHGTPEGLQRELAGDAIHVEPKDPGAAERTVEALHTLGSVREVLRTDAGSGSPGRIRARVPEGASALPGVLLELESRGIEVSSATISRPSLDDVYLKYAGRAFAADEEGV